MKYGKLSLTARLKPWPLFEVRWIKDRWRSRILFAIGCSMHNLSICIRPFLFTVSRIQKIKPTPLSEEEWEEAKKYDTDLP